MKAGLKKTRFHGLPDSENRAILRLLILAHYHRVTDEQADSS